MYLDNGKEDLEYRLLQRHSSPKKKKQKTKNGGKKKTGRHRDPDEMPALGSPGTAADSAESSDGSSPLSFQVPPPSPPKDPAHSTVPYGSGSKFITPEKDGGYSDAFQPVHLTGMADARRHTGTGNAIYPRHVQIHPKHSTQPHYQYAVGYSPGIPKGGRPPLPASNRSYPTQELRTPSRTPHQYQMSPQSAYDPFPLEGDTSLFDMDSSSWPFTSPAGKHQTTPAQGYPIPEARDAKNTSNVSVLFVVSIEDERLASSLGILTLFLFFRSRVTQQDHIQAFSMKLDSIHESIKEIINKADESNRVVMTDTLCRWAKKVAKTPMGTLAVSGAISSASGGASGNANGNADASTYMYHCSGPYHYAGYQNRPHHTPHGHHQHQHASWTSTPNQSSPYGQYYHPSPPNHASPMAQGSSDMDMEVDQKAAV